MFKGTIIILILNSKCAGSIFKPHVSCKVAYDRSIRVLHIFTLTKWPEGLYIMLLGGNYFNFFSQKSAKILTVLNLNLYLFKNLVKCDSVYDLRFDYFKNKTNNNKGLNMINFFFQFSAFFHFLQNNCLTNKIVIFKGFFF